MSGNGSGTPTTADTGSEPADSAPWQGFMRRILDPRPADGPRPAPVLNEDCCLDGQAA